MTDLEPLPAPIAAPPVDAWSAQFARLRERFRGTKDTILFCVHALQNGNSPDLESLKAQASMHGLRITAASCNAARRLLLPPAERQALARSRAARTATSPIALRPAAAKARAVGAAKDDAVEAMIRAVVERVRSDADATTGRLRAAMQQALALIHEALDD